MAHAKALRGLATIIEDEIRRRRLIEKISKAGRGFSRIALAGYQGKHEGL
jgi:hypothetical protein